MPPKSKRSVLFGPKLRDTARPLLEELGKTDRERLGLVLALSTADKIPVSDCLAALYPGRDEQMATKLLRNFRSVLNKAARAYAIPLQFEIDTKKQTPAADRFCWFTGSSRIDLSAEELSRAGVGDEPSEEVLNPGQGTTASAAFSGKRTISVFVCYPRKIKDDVRKLLNELRDYWAMSREFHFEPWGDWEIVAGEEWDPAIQAKLHEADVAMLFLSNAFFQSRYIWENEVPRIIGPERIKPCIPIAMGQIHLSLLDLRGLERRQIFRLNEEGTEKSRSYIECSTPRLKQAFAQELHRQTEAYVQRVFLEPSSVISDMPPKSGIASLEAARRQIYDRTGRKLSEHDIFSALAAEGDDESEATQDCYVDSLGHLVSLESLRDKTTIVRAQDGGMTALAFLESWAVNPDDSPFCAVLGEYGVGKTTTLKQLTHRLLKARAATTDASVVSSQLSAVSGDGPRDNPLSLSSILDPPSSTSSLATPPSPNSPHHRAPLPIYIDLRSYVHADDSTAERLPKLREILAVILERQPRLAHETTLTPDDILTLVREEGALIIFDGLDEKIVHLTPRQSQWFIRELWGALPSKKQFPNRGKMILSCRSHYFPDVRSQQALLTGEDRDDKTADDYRACLVLPFTEKQIRQYLEHVLGADRVERAMELFSAVHNLRELAERPYLLSIIVRQIDKLERKRAAGQTVRATDLYAELAESWLHRDDGKHVFSLDEKQRLMEALAAALTKSGEREWPWDRLEKWLVQFLKHDETTAFRHQKDPHELLEQDLRTAAFILRPDTGGPERLNHFRFAHTSLQEYFLACHLSRALRENRPEHWDLPSVSVETLDFLGQLLASDGDLTAIETLSQILGGDCLPAALLAFNYWLHALHSNAQHQHSPPLSKGGQGGALQNVTNVATPDLTKGEFVAILNDEPGIAAPNYPLPTPSQVNLRGANLEELRIAGRSPDQPLRLRGANLAGAQLNRARLQYVDLTGANLPNLEARQALFKDVIAANANLARADLCGVLWRGGSLAGSKLADTQLAGVQWINVDLTNAALPEKWSDNATVLTELPLEWAFATVTRSTEIGKLTMVAGHGDAVMACAFSPDGRRLLSASADNTLKIWDALGGACLLTLTGHTKSVESCSFSPDGRRIVSGGLDSTVRVWDSDTGVCLLTIDEHCNGIGACAYSPDGRRIVAGSYDGNVKVWDAETGARVMTLDEQAGSVAYVAYDRDGSRIFSGSTHGSRTIWCAVTGACLHKRSEYNYFANSCCINPDGRQIAFSWSGDSLVISEAECSESLVTFKGHSKEISACAFSPDGRRIVSGSKDKTLKLWDVAGGECVLTLDGHANSVNACAWSPDGRLIASGSFDTTLKIWDTQSGTCLLTLAGCTNPVWAAAYSPDGRRIVSGFGKRDLAVWDVEPFGCRVTLVGHTHAVHACCFSSEGHRVLSASSDKTLGVWDAQNGNRLLTLDARDCQVNKSCSYSGGTRRIVSGFLDCSVRSWDAETGECLVTFRGHSDSVNCCSFSHDGTQMVTGSKVRALNVWDVENGTCVKTLVGHPTAVFTCCFSPDGGRILSGSRDKTLKIWQTSTGVCELTLKGHLNSVTSCAFSTNGRRVVSGSSDTTLRVWDADSGACALTLCGHFNTISACAFSPDGRQILSGSRDNSYKIWDTQTGKCQRTTLLLPEQQWATVDFDGNRILAASPEAWRFLC